MIFPTTIRATVSAAAISKASRLFNGSLGDILAEIFQNGRRAGATRILVYTIDDGGCPRLAIADDGCGIDEPAALVALGRSEWHAATRVSEDPAGMGLFSLSGHRVEVRSWSARSAAGWSMIIPANAWDGAAAIEIEPDPHPSGTLILIDLPPQWAASLKTEVQTAARYFPLPVFLHGEEVARADFLGDAVHIARWHGLRIGVRQPQMVDRSVDPRINFHGVTVPCALPALSETSPGPGWAVRVDVEDSPELQLVLPARKEVAITPFLDELKQACEIAIFHAIAAIGRHSLPYKDWLRARALGISLPPADDLLLPWTPEVADHNRSGRAIDAVCGDDRVIISPLEPDLAQTLHRAIVNYPTDEFLPVEPVPAFEGYDWYDALPCVDRVEIHVSDPGGTYVIDPDSDRRSAPILSERPDKIRLDLIGHAGATSFKLALDSDLVILSDEMGWGSVDECAILVSSDSTLTPNQLSSYLVDALFQPSDDGDSDSYDTQLDWFETASLYIANKLLRGQSEADVARIIDAIHANIAWLVPKGHILTADYRDGRCTVQLDAHATV